MLITLLTGIHGVKRHLKKLARGMCHVMEVESFEDDGVAKLLNDWFVSIKVDREERPDVDKVYMTYVQALYGGGGWPLSVFLSPDLKPLMGGTYFPPDDKYGRPGFKTILRKVKEAWESKKDVLVKSGTFAIEQLSEALSISKLSDKLSEEIAQSALHKCTKSLAESYDPQYGGFGSAPKFPRPSEPQSMIYQSKKLMDLGKPDEAEKHLKMVSFSLQCMARGGVHDHVGGVWMSAGMRDMIGHDGEIFSAEDADSAEPENPTKKKEGAFYVWTTSEIEDIVGEHASLFKEHYYIKKSGNCDLSSMSDPHNEFKGKNVLIERKSTNELASKLGMPLENYQEILGLSRKKLFEARSKRPRPHLDDKVIVSWNGLAISSFARASKILKTEPEDTKFNFPVSGTNPQEYMEVAKKALNFIKENLYNSQSRRLQHSFRNGPSKAPGFLDDYAFLISALLDVYEYGGEIAWLSWAVELQDIQAVFEKRLKEAPVAVPLMCCAADMLAVPSKKQVVLVGMKSSPQMEHMLVSVHASYDPNKIVIHIDPSDEDEMGFWKEKNPNVAAMAKSN
ncbi:hypothetical protein M8C21_029020, partial [Ambrosia artemisiifolia]